MFMHLEHSDLDEQSSGSSADDKLLTQNCTKWVSEPEPPAHLVSALAGYTVLGEITAMRFTFPVCFGYDFFAVMSPL